MTFALVDSLHATVDSAAKHGESLSVNEDPVVEEEEEDEDDDDDYNEVNPMANAYAAAAAAADTNAAFGQWRRLTISCRTASDSHSESHVLPTRQFLPRLVAQRHLPC